MKHYAPRAVRYQVLSLIPTKHIAVVTTSRADYGHLYWPLRLIEETPSLKLSLIVMASHLSDEFGLTVQQIEDDGFDIAHRIPCLVDEDSDVAMARTIGLGIHGLSTVLGEMRPDILLLIADRYEMLAPASVALALRIPIAHIEGGDISEGAVDDAVRNALTKMSHLHLTPTEDAQRRVLAMGEEPWRVTWSGAPSLDHLRRSEIPDTASLEQALGMPVSDDLCVIAYHPVTLHSDTTQEADALFDVMHRLDRSQVWCFPNADVGYSELVSRSLALCEQRQNARVYTNLDHLTYWSLLQHASLMVGNSSSGIMETPSIPLPCIDMGDRQRGRTRASNILHADAEVQSILSAIEQASSATFLATLEKMTNPYGDGHASERIIEVLIDAPDRQTLLRKQAQTVGPGGFLL